MTDQPTGARYPVVVALLRRERANAEEGAAYHAEKVRTAEELIAHIRSRAAPRLDDPGHIAWWERNIAVHQGTIAERRELVRQIDAALTVLEGEGE